MATEKNIVMKEFNGTDYDTLYPKTIGTQVDGIFTAEQTLTSNTKAFYGLGTDAVPDDVFAWLGKYNQYWWNRRTYSEAHQVTMGSSGTRGSSRGSTSATITWHYADALTVASGKIMLVDPIDIEIGYSTYTRLATIQGKYFMIGDNIDNAYYAAPDASYNRKDNGSSYTDDNRYDVYISSSAVAQVTMNPTVGAWEGVWADNENAYRKNGPYSGGAILKTGAIEKRIAYLSSSTDSETIRYSSEVKIELPTIPGGPLTWSLVNPQTVSLTKSSTNVAFLQNKYFTTTDSLASGLLLYTTSSSLLSKSSGSEYYMSVQVCTPQAVSDGYEYIYLGKPYENFLNLPVHVQYGSYVGGGGTSGINTKKTLTFSFEPKVVAIFPKKAYLGDPGSSSLWKYYSLFLVRGVSSVYVSGTTYYNNITWSGNTVSWYLSYTGDNTASLQLNGSGVQYYYVAIG